ncbi:Murein DD-endopeptidase MepM and murein hydrolase activator NlpD, contain LysM domain [Vibrio gazogenes DSM 21264]|uniref:Murein DD-endopeptidase MepM and murein hydrolase activator NlpD, contain LysM domain n=2 Tax=Vibrio gazogenes TaxID=687 RepID=A0A1M4T8H4_VIBGA|nr:Murein DD-endopeptidase MepM and murein hydrolase activator NlpD, contain LysM domain [Vibrio gazogenes DSM 21264] [Vibrio gazogenes DSM 21264 = NBRC 103151]
MVKLIVERVMSLSRRQRVFILGLPLLVVVSFYTLLNDHATRHSLDVSISSEQQLVDSLVAEQAQTPAESLPDYEYVIRSGDNLSSIFEQLGFGYRDLLKIMETDLNYLALDTLQPGDTLRFWRTKDGNDLAKMALQFSLVKQVVYTRLDDGSYEYKEINIPGTWKQFPLIGDIQGSFSQSAYRLGLNSNEIEQMVRLLKDKVNFTKDLRAGDQLEIVQSKQFVGDKLTGNSEIQAIKIFTRGTVVSAYLHTDGQYYDQDGHSLQKAFRRYPTSRHWRMSSPFNPFRRHPVTGRIMPHNGTDFATPVGTPVLSTGDGTVIIVRKHPYAGNYIVIRHDSTYMTRYLHLSKILVHRGQKVSRGQKIALSGQSGRVTGAHLHYELIVKGRPVDAMKAKIPMATSVAKKEMKQFIAHRNKMNQLLERQELDLAARTEDNTEQS